MQNIQILVHYNGQWLDSYKYSQYKTKGLILSHDSNYELLIENLSSLLKVDRTSTTFNIKYQIKDGQQPLDIEDDQSLMFYVLQKHKDTDVTKLPLFVSTQEAQQQIQQETSTITTPLLLKETGESSTTQEETDMVETGIQTIRDVIDYADHLSKMMMISCNEEQEQETDIALYEDMIKDFGLNSNPIEIKVGQVFKDKKTLATALANYALKNHFQFITHKSCPKEYFLVCYDQNCHWRLRASRKVPTSMFIIRKFNNIHTCSIDVRLDGHRQATTTMVGEYIKDKMIDFTSTYRAKDVMGDLKRQFGITINYQKAWRCRENALEILRGKSCESYAKLPSFSLMLLTTNPGSYIEIETEDDEQTFKYAYMAISASINGWQYCRPTMVVDGTFLKSNYRGTLLTASTEDGGGNIFPLAFAIVDSENDSSWEWFFTEIKKSFGVREGLYIVSDRHNSIEKAVAKVFPEASHGICTYHLLNNIKTLFRQTDPNIKDTFFGAAKAYTKRTFEYYMKQLEQMNPEIKDYLEKIGHHKWARSHSIGNRYNQMTSNIAESLNSKIKEARELPVTPLLCSLRGFIQQWTARNRKKALFTTTILTEKSEVILRQNYNDSLTLEVSTYPLFISRLHNVCMLSICRICCIYIVYTVISLF